jgi:hypothetical protein
MKYFTPERLVRLQDHSDERQFLAALDDWEAVQHSYLHHLGEIQQGLSIMESCVIPLPSPGNLRKFIKFLTTVSLHDALVLDMDCGGRSRFRITLHPESQRERLVILTYTLAQPPQIKHQVLPEQVCSEPITWLYDELTLPDWKGNEPKTFQHTILLSDGREVGLCSRDVTIDLPTSLVPAVPDDPGSP